MTKCLKVLLIISIAAISAILIAFAAFFVVTAGTNLDQDKLIDYSKTIIVYDDDGNVIESTSLSAKRKSVKLDDLNSDTLNAFIASEDRTFYKHNGINYKRMLKALYKNITTFSFKEGASTISQQLIKNTHLSNDKTIVRKLKEIKLTKQLEKRCSKDEIFEMYLNTIYFGHNCYGLQSAAEFYFDKNADELTLEQSATVVGLLTSPNNFSPYKDAAKCLQRRNTVLKSMRECGFIDANKYEEAVKLPLSVVSGSGKDIYSSYCSALFDELEGLGLNPYGQLTEYRITTYLKPNLQCAVENCKFDCDGAIIVRNERGGISAYKSTIGNAKRQIGSTAKPILVYAPALEEKKIHSFTKIEDEPINFNGYAPENYDKKYHGNVTISDSIKYSYNIPAVKTLNALGVDNAQKYASRMSINLDDDEKNLNLALGGMKNGLTLKKLCDCYSVFQNGGTYCESSFIKEIRDAKGNIIYSTEPKKSNVFSRGTCSIMNDILCETSKSGTAKKLKNYSFDIASKTGTCGNKTGNTDAYAVSYTSTDCICVWLGDKNNGRLQVTGGNECCDIMKIILCELYKENPPAPLEKNFGCEEINIDREEYETNGRILIADVNSPKLNKLTVKCIKDNIPTDISTRFTKPTITAPTIVVNNNRVSISLCQTKYYSYLINRIENDKKIDVYVGKWKDVIYDNPTDGTYIYTVTPYYDDGKVVRFGETITLPQIKIRQRANEDKAPDIVNKDWSNL